MPAAAAVTIPALITLGDVTQMWHKKIIFISVSLPKVAKMSIVAIVGNFAFSFATMFATVK